MARSAAWPRRSGPRCRRCGSSPTSRTAGRALPSARRCEQATGDVVIIQDADSEYYPEDYEGLLAKLAEHPGAAVYGVRDLTRRDPLMRWGNWFVTFATNVLYGSRLHDMETCYKLIDRRVMLALDLGGNGFEIEPEITAKLLADGRQDRRGADPLRRPHRRQEAQPAWTASRRC